MYTGVVHTVGWHPVQDFAATVTYNDGFSEILTIQELEVLMLADRGKKTDILGQSIIRHVWPRYCRKSTTGFD